MTIIKFRCRKCNYAYIPKSSKIPNVCPNCGKPGTLLREEKHLAEIIEIED